MEKLINKFLDYCFKHLDKIKECRENSIYFNTDNFIVYLAVTDDNKVYLSFNKYISTQEEMVNLSSNAEVNLIKYKLEKLFSEKRESQIKELESILEDIRPIQMVTNIEDFSYDEDRC